MQLLCILGGLGAILITVSFQGVHSTPTGSLFARNVVSTAELIQTLTQQAYNRILSPPNGGASQPPSQQLPPATGGAGAALPPSQTNNNNPSPEIVEPNNGVVPPSSQTNNNVPSSQLPSGNTNGQSLPSNIGAPPASLPASPSVGEVQPQQLLSTAIEKEAVGVGNSQTDSAQAPATVVAEPSPLSGNQTAGSTNSTHPPPVQPQQPIPNTAKK